MCAHTYIHVCTYIHVHTFQGDFFCAAIEKQNSVIKYFGGLSTLSIKEPSVPRGLSKLKRERKKQTLVSGEKREKGLRFREGPSLRVPMLSASWKGTGA